MRNKKVVVAFAWLMSTSIGQHLCQLITFVVLARLLTPKEFGVVSASMIVLSFVRLFAELGVGPALVQKQNLSVLDISTATVCSFFFSLVLGGGLFFGVPVIASFFDMPDLNDILRVMLLILPVSSLTVVGYALLQRDQSFKKIALINISSYAAGYMLVAIPLAIFGTGVWSLVAAYLTQAFVSCLLLLIVVGHAFQCRFSFKSAKSLLRYGAGISLAKTGNYFANQADNIIVGKMLGAELLGLYSRAYQLMVMPAMLVGGVVEKILFPYMSELQDQKDNLANLYVRITSLVVMIIMPCSLFLVVYAEEIIQILLGPKWISILVPFQLLAVSIVFRMAYKISESLSHAKSAVYQRAWREFIYAGMVFLTAWVGHFWGLNGVAVGVAFSVFIHFLLMSHLSYKVINFSIKRIFFVFLRNLVAGTFLAFGAYLTKAFCLFIGASYLVTLVCGLFSFSVFYALLLLFIPVLFGNEGAEVRGFLALIYRKNSQFLYGFRLRRGP